MSSRPRRLSLSLKFANRLVSVVRRPRVLPLSSPVGVTAACLLAFALLMPAQAFAHGADQPEEYTVSKSETEFLKATGTHQQVIPLLLAQAENWAEPVLEAGVMLHTYQDRTLKGAVLEELTRPTCQVSDVHRIGCIQWWSLVFPSGAVREVYEDVEYHYGHELVLASAACDARKGNPCDAASGAKLQAETDLPAGAGLPAVTRHYDSQRTLSGVFPTTPFGHGWTSTFHKRLRIQTGTIFVEGASGRGGRFDEDPANPGQWRPAPGTRGRLVEDGSGYTLSGPSGTVARYSRYGSSGRLRWERDARGRTTYYYYNASVIYQLETVVGPDGHALHFHYDALGGPISRISDDAGRTVSYVYDGSVLAEARYADGSARRYHYEAPNLPRHLTGISNVDAAGVATRYATYAYHPDGLVKSSEHAGGRGRVSLAYLDFTYVFLGLGTLAQDIRRQTVVTYADGRQETLTFLISAGSGRLRLFERVYNDGSAYTYDASNNLTCRQDAEGNVTTYSYTADQRTGMIEGRRGDCANPVTTPETRTRSYAYLSAELDLTRFVRRPSVAAGQQAVTELPYTDAAHPTLPTAIIQSGFRPDGTPVSRATRLRYNAAGQVIEIDGPRTDVNDITTLWYYNCTTGAECGQLQAVSNARGQETTYDFYYPDGRVQQQTDPNGVITTYTYDTRGRVATITQTPTGGTARITQYNYTHFGAIETVTTPDGVTLTYGYDAAQDLRSITDNLGNKIEYDYDLPGNRTATRTKDPDGTLVRSVEISYDLRNFVQTINAGGGLDLSVTQLEHDAVGNLRSETDPNQSASASPLATSHRYDTLDRLFETVDTLGGLTGYTYDVNDRLTQVSAPNNATTEYAYDDLGNLLNETSPDRGTLVYTHDAAGNVITATDARGIEAVYTYDALNRLTRVDYPGTEEDITYTYDTCANGIGRLCTVADASGTTGYAYDGFGNLVEQQSALLGVTYTTGYAYDAGNRLTQITYPDGRVIDVGRDPLGRVSRVDATVNGIATPMLSAVIYRADGLAIQRVFGNGNEGRRTYDLQGRLREQEQLISGASAAPSSVVLAADLPSPQPVGKTITYTAQALGGSDPVEYRFVLSGAATAHTPAEVQPYGPGSTWTWAASEADIGSNTVIVEARAVGSTDPYNVTAHETMVIETAQVTGWVTVTKSHASPQRAGTSPTFTAQGHGGNVGAYEYRFYREGPDTNGQWVIVQDYSANDTYTWTPDEAAVGNHRLQAWARNAGSLNVFESYALFPYTIEPPLIDGVALSRSVPSPQASGTPITFTAQAQGGTGNDEYLFQRKGPDTAGTWTIVQNYSPANTYLWTPDTTAVGNHEIQVHARHLGATVSYEARTVIPYTIDNTAGAVQQAATDVSLSASAPSPQRLGTTIVLSAQGQGGSVGSYEYNFVVHQPNVGWLTLQDYATTNSVSWTPTAVAEYHVMVRVRNVGSTAGYEALSHFTGYRITNDYQPLSGVTLTADKPSPQAVGTPINITAQASGGSGRYGYIISRRGPDTNGQFVTVQNYSTNNTIAWTPTVAGDHDFRVYAYNDGYTPYEAAASLILTITETTASTADPGLSPTLVAGPDTPATALIMLADPDLPDATRYWLRSPKTQGQWLAVREVDGYLRDTPDLLAVLKPNGWQLLQRDHNGHYRARRLSARAGLTALPGPMPAALTESLVTETWTYTHDPNGNVRSIQTPTEIADYDYDALDRLIEDTPFGEPPIAHDYDANGNRQDNTTITYEPNSNRIATINGIAVTLDLAGNLTDDGNGWTYTYNNAGRLAEVRETGTLIASHTYNAQGQRTTKATAEGTTVYHYDLAGNLILETTAAGNAIKGYIWAETLPVAQIAIEGTSDTITYLHTDHLATPRVGTDANGAVVWRWEGEAFGATLADEDPDADGTLTTVNLRFPGQYYDQETGLHYNWNRYYDPRIGRYITSDPIGLQGGLNTYLYVNANPGRFVDPDGLVTFGWRRCNSKELSICKKYCAEIIGRPFESCRARVGFRDNIDIIDYYDLPNGLSCSCEDEDDDSGPGCGDNCQRSAVWTFIIGVGWVLLNICTLGTAGS